MDNRTLTDIYNEIKKRPTPAADFVRELCETTHRSEITVRNWVTGKCRPDINVQKVIALHLHSEVDVLFPLNGNDHDNG